MKRKLLIGMVLFLGSIFLIGCKPTDDLSLQCYSMEISIDIYSGFPDLNDYCEIMNGYGDSLDISGDMIVDHNIDVTEPGTYYLTINLQEDGDESTEYMFAVEVVDTRVYQSPTGFYNLSEYPQDVQLKFIAAAEKYLMEHMYGGIPLYSSATYMLKSGRVNYPMDHYVPYIGFGYDYGEMTEDDSSVTMYDGTTGNVGEYTYRIATQYFPITFNQYSYQIESKPYMQYYMGSLYQTVPDVETGGYHVVPALAEFMPYTTTALTNETSTINEYGIEVSNVWNIPIRQGMEWAYYNDVKPSYVTDDTIDANDFIDTFKLALDQRWSRIINGPYDMIDNMLGIENMQDYIQGITTWENVGIKKIDNYTIEFTFNQSLSQQEVVRYFSELYLTPIHMEMYQHLGSNYGLTPDTIAYHGPYQIEEYIENSVMVLKKNELYPLSNYYHYTNISIQKANQDDFLDLYEAGRLDSIPITYEEMKDYVGNDNLLLIPKSIVFKLNINGFGTTDNLQEVFPDSTYQPEPILANEAFRKALYFAVDRQYMVTNQIPGSVISSGLLSDIYVGNIETGIPYRYTDLGMSVLEDFSPDTYGYDSTKALEYFISAVEEEIDNGHYQAGTESNPTIISIDLYYFENSEISENQFLAIENAFETIFNDEEHHVQIDIVGSEKSFPELYYDYILKGEYDLAFGGVSLCTLCNTGLFSQYRSNPAEGFILNWGHDSSLVDVEVEYTDPISGNIVVELWSLDAIAESLGREVYVLNGQLIEAPQVDIIETTTDSFTFSIPDFEDLPIQDITYTIQSYDYDSNEYVNVTPYIDVAFVDEMSTIEGMQITINGLDPYISSIDKNGSDVRQGNYLIKVTYHVEEDEDLVFYLPWVNTESIVTVNLVAKTDLSITLDVEPYDSINRSITSVVLYDPDTGLQATGTIDATDFSELQIFNLTEQTTYVIEFTLDNGSIFYYQFRTTSSTN